MNRFALLLLATLAVPATAQTGVGLYSSSGVVIDGTLTENRVSAVGVASTSFSGPPLGFSASGYAVNEVKRARAEFTALSSDTSGVTEAQFRSLQGYVGNTTNSGYGTSSFLRGNAFEVAVVTPPVTRLVQFGVFFDRSLAVDLRPDAGVVANYFNGFVAANNITDRTTPIRLDVGTLYAEARMEVRFTDQTRPSNNMSYSVFSSWRSGYSIETSLERFAMGDFTTSLETFAGHGFSRFINDTEDPGTPSGLVQLFDEVPASAPISQSAAYVTNQPFWLRGGRTYEMVVLVGCRIDVSDAALHFAGSGATCAADRSGYWNGLVSAVDEFGEQASLPDLIDGNGINYRFPSPLVPVPEPASWAMLIAGLGIIGAVQRRRRLLLA